jgi:hypothetical protein
MAATKMAIRTISDAAETGSAAEVGGGAVKDGGATELPATFSTSELRTSVSAISNKTAVVNNGRYVARCQLTGGGRLINKVITWLHRRR